jgi:hypothetical protein
LKQEADVCNPMPNLVRKMLKKPMFYLSEYLESNRDTYYARLNDISTEGKWNE